MVFHHPVTLRWADLDLLGHVNNVRAMELLQEVRVALLLEVGRSIGYADVPEVSDGVAQVVARIEAERTLEHQDAP